MASWKTRNEVPDSDDDGESAESQLSFPEPNTNSHSATSVHDGCAVQAAESEDELALPSASIRDLTRTSPKDLHKGPIKIDAQKTSAVEQDITHDQTVDDPTSAEAAAGLFEGIDKITTTTINEEFPRPSPPSSPLTELTSSPPQIWSLLNGPIPEAERANGNDQDANPIPLPDSPGLDVLGPDNLVDVGKLHLAQRRSKRKRNAIQLHPYMVENQLYRRSIQDAGIAPVRIVEPEAHSECSDEYEPDPAAANTQEYNVDFNDSLPSKNGALSNLNSFEIREEDDDDEPTSLDALLAAPRDSLLHQIRRGQAGLVPRNYSKRRKRNHTEANSTRLDTPTVAPGVSGSRIPSPPTSSERSETTKSPKTFQYPPGVTPPQLHTPAISSDICPQKGVQLNDTSTLNESTNVVLNGSGIGSIRNTMIQIDSSAESSASENDEAEIKSVRRRIKGVLPASWLRIDQKKQTDTTQYRMKKLEAGSPERNSHRGVARRLPKRSIAFDGINRGTSFMNVDSDDASSKHASDRENSLEPIARLPEIPDLSLEESLEGYSDSMEEDFVDPMLPESSRRVKRRKLNAIQHKRPGNRPTFKNHQLQPRISEHFKDLGRARKSTKKRRQIPLLSITDFAGQSPERLPDFLRVALRVTRARHDGGRQLPYTKIIQLGTPDRMDEASEVLTQWKQRTLACFQSASVLERDRSQSRLPLQHVVANGQRRASAPRQNNLTKRAPQYKSSKRRSSNDRQKSLVAMLTSQAAAWGRGNHAQEGPPVVTNLHQTKRSKAVTSHVFHQASLMPAQLEDTCFHTDSVTSVKPSDAPKRTQKAIQPERAPLLDRFLQLDQGEHQVVAQNQKNPIRASRVVRKARPNSRKQVPQRVKIEAPRIPARYANEDVVLLQEDDREGFTDSLEQYKLHGIGSYGRSYSSDFAIDPFPTGSKIGGGSLIKREYVQYLLHNTCPRDLMKRTAPTQITLGNVCYQWSSWNEDVSVGLGEFFHEVHEQLSLATSMQSREKLCHGFDDISAYVYRSLFFLDTVDRSFCLERMRPLLEEITTAIEMYHKTSVAPELSGEADSPALIPLISRSLILSCQVFQLSVDDSVRSDIRSKAKDTTHRLLQVLIHAILQDGISDLYQYLQASANCSGHWASEQCAAKAEAFTITRYVAIVMTVDIWDLLRTTEPFTIDSGMRTISVLERKWFNLFVILPFFDTGTDGTVSQNRGNQAASECWPLVLALLMPVLDAYRNSDSQWEPLLNEYSRAVLGRCFLLIHKWRWLNCEVLLRALYDFFAKRNLQNLPGEDPVDYPEFLSDFSAASFFLGKSDKAFHIFLKIIGLGLQNMSKLYSEKRLRSIAFRLTPNHSRSMPKEQNVRQEDFDALRNHHNLLCLLYLSLKPSCRPRVSLVQDLIRVEDSHRQACHVSVQTWSDMTVFQLSTQEPTSSLDQFAAWYDDLLAQLIRQHGLARREVESHQGYLSAELRDATILNNQRQVEAVICDALRSLKHAVAHAKSTDAANKLMVQNIGAVFDQFSANISRAKYVLIEGLNVVAQFLTRSEYLAASLESQDFGDWKAIEEEYLLRPHTQGRVLEDIFKSLYTLLSNCLGANLVVDEKVIVKTIETWVSVAAYQIQSGTRQWADFLDLYGKESWHAFRQTDQTAKYAPFFLSLVIESQSSAYKDHQPLILKSWISSLMERESQIRYQARLTSVILNVDSLNPLFDNPPFSKDKLSGLFNISVSELVSRRQSFISTFLSNMAESLSPSKSHDAGDSSLRHGYSELLKTLMKAMKDHYMALDTGSGIRGAYVEFVQAVTGFLQQFTSHIQPIDRFFIDAKNFPLPVDDPSYVVSRLKSYQAKLSTSHGGKQLVAFIQSITERAVLDGHQKYLSKQLWTALHHIPEIGCSSRPTLWRFLIQSIVPAYVDLAIETEFGWLLAQPILRALPSVLEYKLCSLDATNESSVDAVRTTLESMFAHLQSAMAKLIENPRVLEHPRLIRLLSLMFDVITASLRSLDYCLQLQPGSKQTAVSLVNWFCSFGANAFSRLQGREEAVPLPTVRTGLAPVPENSILHYTSTSLRAVVGKWQVRATTVDRGQAEEYEVRGPGAIRTLHPEFTTLEGERDALKQVLLSFLDGVKKLPSFVVLCARI